MSTAQGQNFTFDLKGNIWGVVVNLGNVRMQSYVILAPRLSLGTRFFKPPLIPLKREKPSFFERRSITGGRRSLGGFIFFLIDWGLGFMEKFNLGSLTPGISKMAFMAHAAKIALYIQ